MKAGGAQLEKEAVRYHLQWETVKKSAHTTDDVFRTFCFKSSRLRTRNVSTQSGAGADRM